MLHLALANKSYSSSKLRESSPFVHIAIMVRGEGLTFITAYNDIAAWNHQDMLGFFGAKDGRAGSRAVRTKEEFEAVARLPEFIQPSSIQVCF
jgi:TPP-dependent 2-oxoacid decarboxylase